MKKGSDIFLKFKELYIVHHNLPGQELAGHRHTEHHLFIPIRGRVGVQVQGGPKYSCPEGRMLYLPQQVDHSFHSPDGEGERLIVLIQDRAWQRRKLFVSGPAVLPAQQLLKELLFFMLVRPQTRALESLTASFLEALSESLESAVSFETNESFSRIGSGVTEPRLRKALEYLQNNFRDDVRVGQVAKNCGLSERSLTRAFARELSMTPKNYLMRLRIEEAALRLKSRKLSVTEVAFEVGYSSLSAFIEAFRAVKGQLPSDFSRK